MTIRVAARRLGQPAVAARSSVLSARLGPTVQCRQKWGGNAFKGFRDMFKRSKSDPEPDRMGAELDDPKTRQEHLRQVLRTKNTEGNIFQDEIESPQAEQDEQNETPLPRSTEKTTENMAIVTDPDPRARARWQRRKVTQMVRKRGQLTKEERIKMTERQHLHKSKFLPTSVKKLVMLSRQIAGKPVDDAITQMQWSKKKMAAEIKYYLEEARDLAIAHRGMGLGGANGEQFEKPRKIQTKDGKWMEIRDPTRMYIAQSWVGRGPWRGKSLDYKGRGRHGVLKHPSTSFTVLIKEERTRIREYEERETKRRAEGPWLHLPNRRVYGQRPYYSW